MQINPNIADIASNMGLEKGLISNIVASQHITKIFLEVIKFSGLKKCQKKIGNMFYAIATKLPPIIDKYRQLLSENVGNGQIYNSNQLDYSIEYLRSHQLKGCVNIKEFRTKCGLGVHLNEQQIRKIINEQIKQMNQNSKKIQLLIKIKQKIPYIEGKLIKDTLDKIWMQNNLPDIHDKKNKIKKQSKNIKINKQQEYQQFHIKNISQLIGRQMKQIINSKQNLHWRNQKYNNKILTRFPPQPNGYLHIGHCKAMRFNFMQAKISKGNCYLRFDDTNPIKQNLEFIQNIQQNIHWMGYQPWKITHASQNFLKLYLYAIQLIKQGDAFVCGECSQEVKKKRSESLPSSFRNNTIQANLKLFQEMKLGLYEEGQYSLRAKIDYKHPNTTLRDPAIYRIRYTTHPHVGDDWCIYPLYDFTHPICDSLEGISHSLCSLQFQIRRQLYYWVLDKLDIYRPNVWQYSRLNITNTVLSKRKLQQLVYSQRVNGWDDPRLLTINGMRRKGYPAQAINNFCDLIGVTRRGNDNYIQFNVLQNQVRKYLNIHSKRTMAVLEPIQFHINNLQTKQFTIPYFPKQQTKGMRNIKLTPTIYVEKSDIKLTDQNNFYGIAPNKIIGLKYASSFYIKEIKVVNGQIISVEAEIYQQNIKPNSYLNWISNQQCFDCQVRQYFNLFNKQKPLEENNYLEHFNQDSIQIIQGAKFHNDLLKNIEVSDTIQVQRKGFYTLDLDSCINQKKLVWNLTVSLVDKHKK